MRSVVAMAIVFFCCIHAAYTQAPREVSGRLGSTQGKDLRKLLRELNVPNEIADYYSLVDIVGYRWFNLQPEKGLSLHVLVLPCSSIFGSPILLLKYVKEKWFLIDQEGMDCHYDDSANAQLSMITSSTQYDLMLHHSCGGHGTGYVEQLTRVLRIENEKFHQVFAENDVVHSFEGDTKRHGAFRESTFLPTKAHTLEETEVSTTYDQEDEPRLAEALIRRRNHVWNGHTFVHSAWMQLR